MLGSYPPGADVDATLLNEQVVIIEFTDNLNVTHRVFFYPNETQNAAHLADLVDIRNGSISLAPGYQLTCLCEGTAIATANGVRAIESVRVGDFLLNDLGVAKQVIWIGSSTVSAAARFRQLIWRKTKMCGRSVFRRVRLELRGRKLTFSFRPSTVSSSEVPLLRCCSVKNAFWLRPSTLSKVVSLNR